MNYGALQSVKVILYIIDVHERCYKNKEGPLCSVYYCGVGWVPLQSKLLWYMKKSNMAGSDEELSFPAEVNPED